jgi:type VI secretion system Hcp family effector
MKSLHFVSICISGLVMMSPKIASSQNGSIVIGTIRFEGNKQGVIKGGKDGKSERIDLENFNFSDGRSIDQAVSGSDAKAKNQSPIVITKQVDESSVKLLQAINNNESFKSVEIQLFKKKSNAKEEAFKTIKLSNAYMSKISKEASGQKHASGSDKYEEESFSFTFQKIEIENR